MNATPEPNESTTLMQNPPSGTMLRPALPPGVVLPPPPQPYGPTIPPGVNAAPTFTSLFDAFKRRAVYATAMGVLAALVGVCLVFIILPPQYVADASLLIEPPSSNLQGVTVRDEDINIFKKHQESSIKSLSVLSKALDEYINDEERKDPNGRKISSLAMVSSQSGTDLKWLQKAIKTNWLFSPKTLTVQLAGDDPNEVAMLLNAVVQSYESSVRNKSVHTKAEDLQALKLKYVEMTNNDKVLLENYKQKGGGRTKPGNTQFVESLRQKLYQLETEARQIDKDIIGKAQNLKSMEQQLNDLSSIPVSYAELEAQFSSDSFVQRADEAIKKIDETIAYNNQVIREPFRSQYNREQEFERAKVTQAVDDYKKSRRVGMEKTLKLKAQQELKPKVPLLVDEIKGLEAQRKRYEEEVGKVQTQLGTSNSFATESAQLIQMEQEIESNQKAMEKVKDQIRQFEFAQPSVNVRVQEKAAVPTAKDTSRQLKLAGAAGLFGFLLAASVVSLMEFRTRKIGRPEDIIHGLGLPLVGSIPPIPEKVRRNPNDGAVASKWQAELNEAVDTIRTMLLHAARAESKRVIMVTSPLGGEGKTSLASQLAASLSRAWKKTLLIDGDLRNPANHKLFNVPLEPGLCEVLRGEETAAETIKATPLSRLWVMPAGHWDNHAIQALAQDNVRTVLEQLKQQYDFIIIDSSPVLPVADTLLLGQHVDGVLMTVMRDVSRTPAVYQAKMRMDQLGIASLGVVMIGAKNELGQIGAKYATAAAGK